MAPEIGNGVADAAAPPAGGDVVERPASPDYELDETMPVTHAEQVRAFGEETRSVILSLLLERAASVSELAGALDKPKSTVAHHVNVLEDAGLVRVVRTRKVRAVTERFYGRTALTFLIQPESGADKEPFSMLHQAMRECRLDPDHPFPVFTLRHARIPVERAAEFAQRVIDIAVEFAQHPRSGETVYGFVAGIYPTQLPTFREDRA